LAGEFERELGLGVVRQLFEATLQGLDESERDAALAGAAGLVRPLLLPGSIASAGTVPEPAALMHGLYWLVANLAEERPLVLCVDDAHWCDPALACVAPVSRAAAGRTWRPS
jgi:hypothetical protein